MSKKKKDKEPAILETEIETQDREAVETHEEHIRKSKILLGEYAIVEAETKAEHKRAKKKLEDQCDYVMKQELKGPDMPLFEGRKKCRDCECDEDSEHYFPSGSPDLCQSCADNLEPGEGLSKQAKEALETCPSCGGKGLDDASETCAECGGTGVKPKEPAEAE